MWEWHKNFSKILLIIYDSLTLKNLNNQYNINREKYIVYYKKNLNFITLTFKINKNFTN